MSHFLRLLAPRNVLRDITAAKTCDIYAIHRIALYASASFTFATHCVNEGHCSLSVAKEYEYVLQLNCLLTSLCTKSTQLLLRRRFGGPLYISKPVCFKSLITLSGYSFVFVNKSFVCSY